jgi:hypothetical protein
MRWQQPGASKVNPMGRVYEAIDARLASWLAAQPVFFVATAPVGHEGHVNLSPKGGPSKAQHMMVMRPFSRIWAIVSAPLPVRSR